MKKFLVLLLATISLAAFAQPYRHHPHHPHHVWKPGIGWVIPTIIGGAVVYKIIESQQPVPVVVEKQVVCTEWKEIQTPEGKLYRERSCREENLK